MRPLFPATLALVVLATAGWSSCKGDSSGSGGGAATSSSSATPEAPEVKLPGVDTSPLTPRERKEWSGEVSSLLSPCAEVPVPISQCILDKRDCPSCLPAAKFVMKLVKAGLSGDDLEKRYKNKFDPAAVKDIPLDGSPVEGPANAPVTIVEFADFQCPACQATYPILEQLMQAYAGKIRLVYKLVALPMHARAEPAARAAIAAMWQNKFWEMHHRLFQSGTDDPAGGNVAFEDAALENDARSLGLDLAKFEKDIQSQPTTDRFDKDRKLFDDLKCDHTPTIFVNGRETDVGDLEDTLKSDLGDGGAATAPPAGNAGAAKDAGADAKGK
jgi:protein-disulfide isomerase